MPCDYKRYPKDWKTQIVPMIRERSGDCCEWPGCGVRNGDIYEWSQDRKTRHRVTWDHDDDLPMSKIVLTVAHLDHDVTNNDPENLRHWCQLHHNQYDMKNRQANAASTRARKKKEKDQSKGQSFLHLQEEIS